MYREIVIRAYGDAEIAQIDLIRELGINLTELVLSAIMNFDVKPKKKNKFNALYGMSVTNNIRDNVIYDDKTGIWSEVELTNDEIEELVGLKEADKNFLKIRKNNLERLFLQIKFLQI